MDTVERLRRNPKGSLVLVFLIIVLSAGTYWAYVAIRGSTSCDQAAERDATSLGRALERLHNELLELRCPTPSISKKHLAYMMGPYYGWRGTSLKSDVRVRVEHGQALVCSTKGSREWFGKEQLIYPVSLAPPYDVLPCRRGLCYGDVYGGKNARCCISSIAESMCGALKAEEPNTADVQTCEAVRLENKPRMDYLRVLAATGLNSFGVELYKRLIQRDSNLVVSPFGYYIPLAMAYAGARGNTHAQMQHVMRLEGIGDELHDSLGALLRELRCGMVGTDGHLDLDTVLVVRNQQPIRREFKDLVFANYGVDVDRQEFSVISQSSGPPSASRRKKSKGESMARTVLHPDTALILLNEIDFNGMWCDDHNFDDSATADGPFYLLEGSEIKVPMMFRQGRFRYLEDKDFQGLELLYEGKEISMVVLLPRERDGLLKFEKSVTSETLSQWLSNFDFWPYGVKVWLPRFDISASLPMAEALSAMGMPDAFCSHYKGCKGKNADFSGISGRLDPNVEQPLTDLFISEALQNISLEVNERGSEIRAQSMLCAEIGGSNGGGGPVETERSKPPPPPEPKIFRADHPFMFIVRHNHSNAIIFVGRLTSPL